MVQHRYYISLVIFFILMAFVSMISATPTSAVDVLIRLEGQGFIPEEDMSDNYVVSDSTSDTVAALIHATGKCNEVSSDSDSMSLNTSINSKTYLVYTKGDRNTIDSRIPILISDDFDTIVDPSFGFPLSKKNIISISLEYENINVVSKDIFGAGFHDLIIGTGGEDGNRYLIDIRRK